ncbi:hypothetical protein Acr_00g0000380 [Actinidia rufa]|uniref:Uncharacterized protein n=1 Tax=Actinidia rufa TaxID=165716 RepID=A0A7J0D692_9ERIC|nr:hypothetical protein Acr_00g0000380 [Actinidia rufa]
MSEGVDSCSGPIDPEPEQLSLEEQALREERIRTRKKECEQLAIRLKDPSLEHSRAYPEKRSSVRRALRSFPCPMERDSNPRVGNILSYLDTVSLTIGNLGGKEEKRVSVPGVAATTAESAPTLTALKLAMPTTACNRTEGKIDWILRQTWTGPRRAPLGAGFSMPILNEKDGEGVRKVDFVRAQLTPRFQKGKKREVHISDKIVPAFPSAPNYGSNYDSMLNPDSRTSKQDIKKVCPQEMNSYGPVLLAATGSLLAGLPSCACSSIREDAPPSLVAVVDPNRDLALSLADPRLVAPSLRFTPLTISSPSLPRVRIDGLVEKPEQSEGEGELFLEEGIRVLIACLSFLLMLEHATHYRGVDFSFALAAPISVDSGPTLPRQIQLYPTLPGPVESLTPSLDGSNLLYQLTDTLMQGWFGRAYPFSASACSYSASGNIDVALSDKSPSFSFLARPESSFFSFGAVSEESAKRTQHSALGEQNHA